MKRWTRGLQHLGACQPAIDWCQGYDSMEAAWAACQRGNWMLWYAGRLAGPPGSDSRKPLVLAHCECARRALAHMPPGEDRPMIAIETAESWARGQGATLDDVCAAGAYAEAVSYAITDAAAYAINIVFDAAYAEAVSYADADAYADIYADIYAASIVRKYYPRAPEKKERNDLPKLPG